ncbi:hypothetical protein FRZ61_21430 [Hypericibacter adhaerens]|uniref:Autotransporter domain-containing protein n=1 Tax=Hypericibacter adhaerens TaxID=2602016 RepID=A0A5J6MZ22_9PROT|nr:autotransporter domain-containing protein [Hypericibacter adhaerens]QEX22213.1 hypothetical protein FRZ61_21430 [Hypericibacter adhaerens]
MQPDHPDTRARVRSATARLAAIAVLAVSCTSQPCRAEIQVTAYIPQFLGTAVSIVDTGGNTVVGTQPAENIPYGVTVTPDGRVAYVTNINSSSVTVIDAATNTVTGTIAIGGAPYGIVASPDGKFAYVVNASDNAVSIIDTGTNAIVGAAIPVGAAPVGIALTPDGGLAYVTNFADNTVSVIDTTTNSVIGSPIPVGLGPRGVAVSADGRFVYVTNQLNNSVSVIDANHTVVASIGVGIQPSGIAMAPDGRFALVANSLSNTVSVIDTATNIVTATIPVGTNPYGIAVTPDGRFAYVTNQISNDVLVIDISTNTVVGSPIAIPNQPIAFGSFIGPNVIVPAGGPLSVSSDAALAARGFQQFMNFNGGTLLVTGSLNSSRSISLLAQGGTIDTNGFDSVFSGPIVGTGALTKLGDGTLSLTGTSSYSGGTTVGGGTLRVGADTNLGDPDGALTLDGGTLQLGASFDLAGTRGLTIGSGGGTIDTNGFDTVISQGIAGTGALDKTGAGSLILNGINSYGGMTTATDGTLGVGDVNHPAASLLGSVTIGSDGTLAGHGTVSGDVANLSGGTTAPGGSIGTLSIGGDYTQGPSSRMSIEVSPGGASQLAVSGTAGLDGQLVLVFDPGVYTSRQYTIVSAGLVSGTFSSVAGDIAQGYDFNPSLEYLTNAVNLTIDPVLIEPANDTVFTALSTVALQGAHHSNFTLFDHLADRQLGTGSDNIQTAIASALPSQLALGDNVADVGGLVAQLPDAMTRMGGWFRALGQFTTLDGSGGVPGFDAQSGGFLAGLDRALTENVTSGIAVGYAHTNLDEHGGSDATMETPRVALYGSASLGIVTLDATVGYAHDFIDADRPIDGTGETASSSHGGDEATGAFQLSSAIPLDRVTVTPRAGLSYVHLFEGSFTETGAGGSDLDVSNKDADSMRPFVGLTAARPFVTEDGVILTPTLDITYSHEVMDASPSNTVEVGGGRFKVDGLTPSRDQVAVGAGFSAEMNEQLALYADYHVIPPTGNLFAQAVSIGFRYRF